MKGNSGKRPANGEQKRDLAQKRRDAEGEANRNGRPGRGRSPRCPKIPGARQRQEAWASRPHRRNSVAGTPILLEATDCRKVGFVDESIIYRETDSF